MTGIIGDQNGIGVFVWATGSQQDNEIDAFMEWEISDLTHLALNISATDH